jgi:hypothetical protein
MEVLTAKLGDSLHFTNGEKQGIFISEVDTADLWLKSGRKTFGRTIVVWAASS